MSWGLRLLLAFALVSQPAGAQEVLYAPPAFKVSAPPSLDVSPVLMTELPVTIDGTPDTCLVLVLVVRQGSWPGTLTADNVVLSTDDRSVPARLVGIGRGASLTVTGTYPQTVTLVTEKRGIVVGAAGQQVTLAPIHMLNLAGQRIGYSTDEFPAQLWFVFPYAGGATTIRSVRIDTVVLERAP